MKKIVDCSRDFVRDFYLFMSYPSFALMSKVCKFCCLPHLSVCCGNLRCPSDLDYMIPYFFENYVKTEKKLGERM